jgi:hypothetical protein
LPTLTQSIRLQGDAFYIIVADLMLAVALDHARSLTLPRHPRTATEAATAEATATPASPRATQLLDDPQTRLADLARFLTTPARSGIFLGRVDIARLAQRDDLPRGFGDRATELENLLHAAARFQTVSALAGDLEALLQQWRGFYNSLDDMLVPQRHLWLTRLDDAALIAARLRTASTS